MKLTPATPANDDDLRPPTLAALIAVGPVACFNIAIPLELVIGLAKHGPVESQIINAIATYVGMLNWEPKS